MSLILHIINNKYLWQALFFIWYHFLFLISLSIKIYSRYYFLFDIINKNLPGALRFIWYHLLFLTSSLIKIYGRYYFLFDINDALINGFSLTYGFISFFFNSAFPYPGNDFTVIWLLFNIWFACFVDISSIPSLIYQ